MYLVGHRKGSEKEEIINPSGANKRGVSEGLICRGGGNRNKKKTSLIGPPLLGRETRIYKKKRTCLGG